MNQFEIRLLSTTFYNKYPSDLYPEILDKGDIRPYLMLLITIDGLQYAIPFRSNIKHKYAFMIKNTRSLNEGLDFTKAVIINDQDKGRVAKLRPGNYGQVEEHIELIILMFRNFLKKYKEMLKKETKNMEEERLFQMSTLKYFI